MQNESDKPGVIARNRGYLSVMVVVFLAVATWGICGHLWHWSGAYAALVAVVLLALVALCIIARAK